MKNNKLVIISIYILIVIIITLHFIGLLFVTDICRFYYDKKNMLFRLILLFVCIPLFGFLTSLLLKIKKRQRFNYTILIPFIAIFIGLFMKTKIEEKQLYNFDLVIRKAYIEHIYIGNPTKYVTVNLKGLKDDYKWDVDIKKYKWRKLKVGDSLLVIYAKDCPVLHKVYELYPTKKQFEQFEKDPYYHKYWNK